MAEIQHLIHQGKNDIRVAIAQFKPKLNDPSSNLEVMTRLLITIMRDHPNTSLIVMPELCTTGYECGSLFLKWAETLPDCSSVQNMTNLCRKYHVHLIYGTAEKEEGDVVHDSAILLGDRGDLLGVYQKIHLFAEEGKWFKPGNSYPVFQTSLGKIGLLICYDVSFPESARIIALHGADLLIVPANWEEPHTYEWKLSTSARSFENTLHLIAANRIGSEKHYSFFGGSRILDPLGRPIAEGHQNQEEFVMADIDLDLTSYYRQQGLDFLHERMPQTYSDLVAK